MNSEIIFVIVFGAIALVSAILIFLFMCYQEKLDKIEIDFKNKTELLSKIKIQHKKNYEEILSNEYQIKALRKENEKLNSKNDELTRLIIELEEIENEEINKH